MVTTRAARRGRQFELQRDSQSQSTLLRLPAELRYKIYSEIYLPRIYHLSGPLSTLEVEHPDCKTPIYEKCWQNECFRWADHRKSIDLPPRTCYDSHRNCGCNLTGAVRFLRVCQQVYIEAQPCFLLSPTLAFQSLDSKIVPKRDSEPLDQIRLSRNVAAQLRMFHQRYLCSSLSGLSPIELVKRLRLGLSQWKRETKTCLKFIRDCEWQLESLDIWQYYLHDCSQPRYLESEGFQGMAFLRNVKKMTSKWDFIDMGYLVSENNHGPLGEDDRLETRLVGQDLYADIVSQALSELASRPIEKKKRSRASMHEEAKEIFLSRFNQLSADAGRSFVLDPDL
jgi:hypothetical protein